MLTYLFIGLFVAAFNAIWRLYVKVQPSVLGFLVCTVIWPVVIIGMFLKTKEFYNER